MERVREEIAKAPNPLKGIFAQPPSCSAEHERGLSQA